ncbi:MAG: aminoacyl-tRNA deacylase [Anaerolineales bacterium]
MTVATAVTRALDSAGIPYTLHVHSQPVHSLEQAASERGLAPEQIVRSLLFRLENQQYLLALIPGPSQVDWSKLRHFLGVSRVTTANADEVRRVTGYEPGSVSPFGLPTKMRILADPCLKQLQVVSLGAGIRNAGIILNREDLERLLELEWVDLRTERCGPADVSL